MDKPAEGLGDTVAKGIKAVQEVFNLQIFEEGRDCGCDKRKELLNKILPYRFKARCLTESEYNNYTTFKEKRTLKMDRETLKWLCELYASVFNRQYWFPSCLNCSGTVQAILAMQDKLDKVHSVYESELKKQ